MSSDSNSWRLELEASTVTRMEGGHAPEPVRVPTLTVLHHPDLRRVGETAPLGALHSGRCAELSRLEPRFAPPRGGEPRPLVDSHLSRRPLGLRPAGDEGVTIDVADSSVSLVVDGRPISSSCDLSRRDLDTGVTLRLADRVVLFLHRTDPTPSRVDELGLIGESLAIDSLRRDILRAARLDAPVLIRGETGSGKELVAEALHRGSPRRRGPFVAVNMAAITPSLAAAEIFGTVSGAYTGASARPGLWRRADGGSLLLDELGEAPAELQALLLRALETSEIQPVGADRPSKVDVRIFAATDADLEQLTEAGDFRAPLIHRLAGFSIRVPALRHRRDDIPRLLHHFLRQELQTLGALDRLRPTPRGQRPWLDAMLAERLVRYGWPGNVRQLRNVARHLAAEGCTSGVLDGRAVERLLTDDGASSPEAASADVRSAGGDGGRREWRGMPSRISEDVLRQTLREHE
ncbi:MAG: sigma 54-interacting transcriptional regulator, partial [Acidobacteriota bacterium]